MGVDSCDINGDRIGDLFITNYQDQTPTLFISQAEWGHIDETARRQVGRTIQRHVNWGAAWGDFDLDGDADLMVLNGHFLSNQDAIGTRTKYGVSNSILQQRDNGRFHDISSHAWTSSMNEESSRGLAVEDFDLDGDLDAIILNCSSSSQFFVNTSKVQGNSLRVRLVGTACNRDAVGALVSVKSATRGWHAEIRSGRGYQSHFGSTLHFGLGSDEAQSLSIKWPQSSTEETIILEPRRHATNSGMSLTIIQQNGGS
jgi:hypothetical protein